MLLEIADRPLQPVLQSDIYRRRPLQALVQG